MEESANRKLKNRVAHSAPGSVKFDVEQTVYQGPSRWVWFDVFFDVGNTVLLAPASDLSELVHLIQDLSRWVWFDMFDVGNTVLQGLCMWVWGISRWSEVQKKRTQCTIFGEREYTEECMLLTLYKCMTMAFMSECGNSRGQEHDVCAKPNGWGGGDPAKSTCTQPQCCK
eukprot:1158110-Pelagomonas_calceolata.AAC.8